MKKHPESRRDIVAKAAIECLDEMYRKSQPSITWKEILKITSDPANEKRHLWAEHYLSKEDYEDIQDHYMRLYRIKSEWEGNVELVEEYLKEGGSKDVYIPEYVDEDGDRHPGHRDYEHVLPMATQIRNILEEHARQGNVSTAWVNEIKEEICKALGETITNCKNFYKHDRDEVSFRMDVSNYSPCSNADTVREFYEQHPEIKLKKPIKD